MCVKEVRWGGAWGFPIAFRKIRMIDGSMIDFIEAPPE